jgi:SAM-dependent methyltransferase
MNSKLKVLLQRPRALLEISRRGRNPESRNCPSCGGSPERGVADRRFGIMFLRRCSQCLLLYRTPTDTPAQSREFYQSDYTEETVTELPDLQTLEEMKSSDFSSKGNLSPYIDMIRRFYPKQSAKLVDYGCSWGYNIWKFLRAGFLATGVEVSRPRCDFGRVHLDVEAHYSADELASDHDVFFSSHVFEHVPSPGNSYREARRLLGDHGGLFIVITPNGSDAFRKTRPARWHELWGRKHPNFLDERFWEKLLEDVPHVIMSRSEDRSVLAPLESIDLEALANPIRYDLTGEELIVVASLPALSR